MTSGQKEHQSLTEGDDPSAYDGTKPFRAAAAWLSSAKMPKKPSPYLRPVVFAVKLLFYRQIFIYFCPPRTFRRRDVF